MSTDVIDGRVPYMGLAAILGSCALWGVFAMTAIGAARPDADLSFISSPKPAPVTVAPAPVVAPPPPAFSFVTPLPGQQVNSSFGMRQLPWEEAGRLHKGVDIAAPEGAPVLATLPGTVIRSGEDAAYGRFVEVAHDHGLSSLYAHLGRKAKGMRKGSAIDAGQVIGHVGSSGRSTGSHLHFEIRHDGDPVNPTYFMGRQFAQADDLPLTAAARVSRKVRMATVSNWPKGVRKKAAQQGERPRAVIRLTE
ncbi:M23 family metallopeptidase [Caulobacter sp. NIBR2454]|uniref:M23 family metallopeptidase n=1 Tax=Caulobacter sp. NIBR2454 TaxID=3015996 RepID=UPI0022B734EA|nr:M23 family metallopeptidase [Caulobacter sp. NIBR2454]